MGTTAPGQMDEHEFEEWLAAASIDQLERFGLAPPDPSLVSTTNGQLALGHRSSPFLNAYSD